MKLVRANCMGFCKGVLCAIKKVEECLRTSEKDGKPAYSLGRFIHNPLVIKEYTDRGLVIIEDGEGHEPGNILIRAHGVGDAKRRALNQQGFTLMDGTCPTVARSQFLLRNAAREGRHIIIMGLHDHDETQSLLECETEPGHQVSATVVESCSELDQVPMDVPLTVIVQTTFPEEGYKQISTEIKRRFPDRDVVFANKLCPSSTLRRESLRNMCKNVDAVVIIGSRTSANTNALVEVSQATGTPTWHVEDASELPRELIHYDTVGITAGASTSPKIILSVEQRLMELAQGADEHEE